MRNYFGRWPLDMDKIKLVKSKKTGPRMDEEKTYKIMEKSNIFIGLITKDYFSDPDAVLQMRKVVKLQKPCILLIEKPQVDTLPEWIFQANIQATINFYNRDMESAFKKIKVVMENISDKI